MKKILFLFLIICLNISASFGFKNYERSGVPWVIPEEDSLKDSNKDKNINSSSDTCPLYQVYTKKVVTASSRGEIENTGWILKEEFRSCDPVDTKEKRVGYDVNYIRQGDPDEEMITSEVYEKKGCATCFNCKDVVKTGVTKHKITFHLLKDFCKQVADAIGKIPKVKKVSYSLDPTIEIKEGEECCSYQQPPVAFTEINAGMEEKFEVEIDIGTFPSFNYTSYFWTYRLEVDFGIYPFIAPFAKGTLKASGKFYGANPMEEGAPVANCVSCFYLGYEGEAGIKGGLKAEGFAMLQDVKLTPSPVGGRLVNVLDEIKVGVKGEASITLSIGLNMTLAGKYCKNPKPGFHGKVGINPVKGNLKASVDFGPWLSYEFNYEYLFTNEYKLSW